MGFFRFEQTRPEIDDPRATPSGMSAAVRKSIINAFSYGPDDLRSLLESILPARMQPEKRVTYVDDLVLSLQRVWTIRAAVHPIRSEAMPGFCRFSLTCFVKSSSIFRISAVSRVLVKTSQTICWLIDAPHYPE